MNSLNRSVSIVATVCFVAGLFAVSCGPPRGKEVDELNESQARKLCRKLSKKDDCTLNYNGFEFTLKAPDKEDCDDEWEEPQSTNECNTTVGEVLDCYNKCTKEACEKTTCQGD